MDFGCVDKGLLGKFAGIFALKINLLSDKRILKKLCAQK